MIDPKAVLNAVQKALVEDSQIAAYLQLDTLSFTERAPFIIKRSQFSDLANNKSRVCIYFRPARGVPGNQLFTEDIIQIDVHVPVARDMYAYDVIRRAHELLDDKVYAYHTLRLDGQLGDLPTATNYFCAGTRYRYYATRLNK